MKKKMYLAALVVALFVAIAGVALAQEAPAGQLVSGLARDWHRWVHRDGHTIYIRTKFKGNLADFADPASAWSDIYVSVPKYHPSLDVYSGVHIVESGRMSNGDVVYSLKPRPLLIDNGDGTQTTLMRDNGEPYVPQIHELRLDAVTFIRANNSVAIETFFPVLPLINMTNSDTTDGDSSSGGCSTGAVVGFAGLLLAPLALLRKRD